MSEEKTNGFPKGAPNTAYARYFTGNSFLAPLTSENAQVSIANVTFEPACRNAWHIHHGAQQILVCVSGRGWYQEWGKEPQELHAGDVVEIPLDTKHWHGAAGDSWFAHLSVTAVSEMKKDTASTEWLEPVSEEDYNRLP